MLVRQFVLDGLGHLSSLVADEGSRLAAVIDPRRDVDEYLAAAAERDLRISHVIETHLHNDYVSGGRELVAATGAEQVIGAGADLHHPYRPIRDGEVFDVGALRFTALDTPGHTPEHVAYAVADTSRAEEPALLFTGGSLLVGSVGRTDLLGAEAAIPAAHAMYRSLHDVILGQQDFVEVYPTHGAGSLCSTGISPTSHSTIGYERRYNPLLQPADVDAFARALLSGQPAFPRYFARMRPLNQAGPPVLGPVPPPLGRPVEFVRRALDRDALLIDLRPPVKHAARHVPGSLSIPGGTSFGTWLGWVVADPDRPLVLLLDSVDDWDDAIRQSRRVGFESVVGYLDGGLDAWAAAGLPVESGARLTVTELARALDAGGPEAPLVIDVRQASEYEAGHVPGALAIGAGDLPERLAGLARDRRIVTICETGYRASLAASLLRSAGFEHVSAVTRGLPKWAAEGLPVEYGPPPGGDPLAAIGSNGAPGAAAAGSLASHSH